MSLRGKLDECGELQGTVGVAVVADGMQGKHERLLASWAMTSDDPQGCARLQESHLSPTLSLTRTAEDRVRPRRPLAYSIDVIHELHSARPLL